MRKIKLFFEGCFRISAFLVAFGMTLILGWWISKYWYAFIPDGVERICRHELFSGTVLAMVGIISACTALYSFLSDKRRRRVSISTDLIHEFSQGRLAEARRFSRVVKTMLDNGITEHAINQLIRMNTTFDKNIIKHLKDNGIAIKPEGRMTFEECLIELFNFWVRVNAKIDNNIADGKYLLSHLCDIFEDEYKRFEGWAKKNSNEYALNALLYKIEHDSWWDKIVYWWENA